MFADRLLVRWLYAVVPSGRINQYNGGQAVSVKNILLVYSRSLSLTPFKPQAFEILMSKSSIFSKKTWRLKG